MWHLVGHDIFSCRRNCSPLPLKLLLKPQFRPARPPKPEGSPGLHGQLRVEHAGGNAKLLQEQLEPVAPVQRSDKHQRLALNQPQPQQSVDEQKLVLLLAPDAVLLQLAAVWQLRALELQDDLRGDSDASVRGKDVRPNRCACATAAAQVRMTLQGCAAAAPSGPGHPRREWLTSGTTGRSSEGGLERN